VRRRLVRARRAVTSYGLASEAEWCSWAIFHLSPSLTNTIVDPERAENRPASVTKS
jgi:hypothetical protein